MAQEIVIVDYGMGNLFSIYKKLSRKGLNPVVASDAKIIQKADKIILPGVGHFRKAMDNLDQLNLLHVLNEQIMEKKKPILGICLGMQLFANSSEEGNAVGLKWIDAEVVKFQVNDKIKYKIPHMGWNQIRIAKESELMKDIPDASEFYFVHSYYMKAKVGDILNETEYEETFTSAVEKENIFGVQYHPEKSHDAGDLLLKNFVSI